MFGECFNSVHISKLVDIRFAYARFHKGDEESHDDVEGIKGELKRGNVEVLKHRNEKRIN